nr:DUF2339 domain-containing protein [Caldalkalibacillus salinus]
MNKIGILLILFGVAAAARYTYATWFTDEMKGISFFLLGGLLLVSGEFFNKRKSAIFSMGLIGGGVSVLYAAIFYSYFLLDILPMPLALGVSILVTASAVTFALRYDSKTIGAIGLIGGFLPFFSYTYAFGLTETAALAAMGYLFLLNTAMLVISFYKKWSLVQYLSFVVHLPSLFYLLFTTENMWMSLLYALLTFCTYAVITLGYAFKHKVTLKVTDVVLLGLNTLFSCLAVYLVFEQANWTSLRGGLALGFCVLYIALARFVSTYLKHEKATIILFYVTALTFAILMIPFQFGMEWMALGWLIEAVMLIIYGLRNRLKWMEAAGWVIFLLCTFAFYLFDFLEHYSSAFHPYLLSFHRGFFEWKYTAYIVGLCLILWQYLQYQQRRHVSSLSIVRDKLHYLTYYSIINVWLFATYLMSFVYNHYVFAHVTTGFNDFYYYIIMASIHLLLAIGITKIKVILDKVTQVFAFILYSLGALILWGITAFEPILPYDLSTAGIGHYIALSILVFYNVFIFVGVREILLLYIRKSFKSLEIYPLAMSLYLLGIITIFLSQQLSFYAVGLTFSVIYILLAICFILYGFKYRYVSVRRFGLGLTLFATGKLFLYDLSFLNSGSKIFAYFCFGIVLLAISFIYQKISSKMEATRIEKQG